MSGVRIYDLAKELKLTNGDLLDMLKGMGESGKTASSTINDVTADAIRKQASDAQSHPTNGTPTQAAEQRNGSKARDARKSVSDAAGDASDPHPNSTNPVPSGNETSS